MSHQRRNSMLILYEKTAPIFIFQYNRNLPKIHLSWKKTGRRAKKRFLPIFLMHVLWFDGSSKPRMQIINFLSSSKSVSFGNFLQKYFDLRKKTWISLLRLDIIILWLFIFISMKSRSGYQTLRNTTTQPGAWCFEQPSYWGTM